MGQGQSKTKEKILLIGGGVIAAGLVASYLMKSKTPQGNQDVQHTEKTKEVKLAQQNQNVTDSQLAQANSSEQLLKIASSIQVEYSNSVLSLKTITQILEKSLLLAKDEYKILTLHNREKRRLIKKSDSKKYQELVLDYNDKVEELLEKKQEQLCQSLNINIDLFQESVMELMNRGFFQQFFMIQASIRQQIKESIQSTKSINKQDLYNIISYQVALLKQKPIELEQIITNLNVNQELAQMIPLAVNTVLADYIYEQFQIEEEDMIKLMQNPDILTEQKLQDKMRELEENMVNLMGIVGM